MLESIAITIFCLSIPLVMWAMVVIHKKLNHQASLFDINAQLQVFGVVVGLRSNAALEKVNARELLQARIAIGIAVLSAFAMSIL